MSLITDYSDLSTRVALCIIFIDACAFLLSWFIPQRPERKQDWWGPTRGFAKIQDLFKRRMSEAGAAFLTEVISGILHAPFIFLAILKFTNSHVHAWWAAGLVSVFWVGVGFGRALVLERRSRREKGESALDAFLRDPLSCLNGYDGRSPWRDDGCVDIYVKSHGKSIAYIHQIAIDRATGNATIGHFAVERGLERKGVGRRLALILRAELAWRYGVKQIIFAENSTRYDDARYEDFFKYLGAQQQLPSHYTKPGRADWAWQC
ncbi:hypothetical protein [Paraburkholderia caribensis]|uniref:hypothetical protein n=1 Tax=Paraburkholderia caribensis TaxID=75105 RepID=UPI001CAE5EBB|nr:hypothetical protein [Paraburkholderia caribensis]CAG9243708.1 membrane hypothetical protein [Paraburkholderia caribensis]